jgi:hypothetical protein
MGDNIFQRAAKDPQALQEELLGPTYNYTDFIKNPAELGMSGKGTIKTLGKDINGLISYVELLLVGDSKASKTGGPLGNKFFLRTGSKCMDASNDLEVDRYIYINNVPQGNIPFLSSSSGINFGSARGLIPGAMGNLGAFNPFGLLGAFVTGGTPECQQVTLETIDSHNNSSEETHFVTKMDIRQLNPCNFKNTADKKNPVTGVKCKENFSSMNAQSSLINARCPNIQKDPLSQAYIASLGVFGIFILYKMMYNKK